MFYKGMLAVLLSLILTMAPVVFADSRASSEAKTNESCDPVSYLVCNENCHTEGTDILCDCESSEYLNEYDLVDVKKFMLNVMCANNQTMHNAMPVITTDVHLTDQTVSDHMHTIHDPSANPYVISTGVLAFTNVLLVIVVMLCGFTLHPVQHRPARHGLCLKSRTIQSLKMFRRNSEEIKTVSNPTYEEPNIDQDQETPNGNQPISSQYSTLEPTYEAIGSGNLCALMLPETNTAKKGKKPQCYTDPAKYTRRIYDVVSVNDANGYSRLVQQ